MVAVALQQYSKKIYNHNTEVLIARVLAPVLALILVYL